MNTTRLRLWLCVPLCFVCVLSMACVPTSSSLREKIYNTAHLNPKEARFNPKEKQRVLAYYRKTRLARRGLTTYQNGQRVHWRPLLAYAGHAQMAERLHRRQVGLQVGFSVAAILLAGALIIPGSWMAFSLSQETGQTDANVFLPGLLMMSVGAALFLTPLVFGSYSFHIYPPQSLLKHATRQYNADLRRQLEMSP